MDRQFTVGVTAMITLVTVVMTAMAMLVAQSSYGIESFIGETEKNIRSKVVVNHEEQVVNAPIATSGNNVYVVWPSNKTGDLEIMLRASRDGGQSFGDKINLSNTPNADSVDAQIAAEAGNVFVSWWERNQTRGTNEPVARLGTNNGQTFGPILMLGNNGTLTR
jgi:hypothetical protein